MPKKKKIKKRKSLLPRFIFTALFVTAVFVMLFFATKIFGEVPLSKATDAFTAMRTEAGEYPFEIDADTVEDVVPFGSGVALLKKDSVDILSKSGKLLQSVKHKYVNAALEVRNGRAILFDRGGSRYMVLSKTQMLSDEKQADGVILDAGMSPDGKHALAVTTGNAKSVLSVYDTSFEEYFKWKCVSEYITDIDFTRNGSRVSVSLTGVKNATPYSKVLLFDFKEKEPVLKADYDGVMAFAVSARRSSVVVASDDYIGTVKKNGEKLNEKTFGGDTMKNFCFEENGRSAVLLISYGNERAVKLYTTKKNGSQDYEAVITEKTIGMSRSRYYTCVLTEDKVLTYNNSGKLIKELALSETVRDICVSGRNLFVLYSDRIEKYSAS